MEGFKSLVASRTFWGGLLAVIAGIATLFGYSVSPDDQAQLATLLTGIGSSAGGAVAILGRIFASKRIGKAPAALPSILLVLLVAASLPGCAANGVYQKVDAFDKAVVEPEVDAALSFTVGKLCKLPADTMVRQIQHHGLRVLQAAVLVCPEWQALASYFMSDALSRLGMLTPDMIETMAARMQDPAAPAAP